MKYQKVHAVWHVIYSWNVFCATLFRYLCRICANNDKQADVDDVTSPAVLTCIVGIRSQSKPLDIMHEVFKAMKSLDYVSCSLFYLAGLWVVYESEHNSGCVLVVLAMNYRTWFHFSLRPIQVTNRVSQCIQTNLLLHCVRKTHTPESWVHWTIWMRVYNVKRHLFTPTDGVLPMSYDHWQCILVGLK